MNLRQQLNTKSKYALRFMEKKIKLKISSVEK